MRTIIIVVLLLTGFTHAVQAGNFNIRDFGAVTDTIRLSTAAIQAAIDACNREGGVVYFPAGTYLSGTLMLKSNVTLYLEKGATLYGSRQLADYKPNIPGYVALRTRGETKQLIFAENQHNISITGEGEINGQGRFFADKTAKGVQYDRPHLIQMINCSKILVENVSLRNSGCWMEHYLACEDLKIRGIRVYNHSNKNNDGIDIDGCRNVTISDVTIDSDDDALCIKSTSGRASENIAVTNCVLSSHCNAFKLGTESNTGFRNIAASNLVIKPSVVNDRKIYGHPEGASGLSVEMVDGGILDGVAISNITIEGTFTPIFIRLGNRGRPYRDGQVITNTGILRNVSISHVVATGAKNLGCSVSGIPGHPVENISLSDISISFGGGGTLEQANAIVPEKEKEYPEAEMFGMLPSYGFFIRHATQVRLADIRLVAETPDQRPGLALSDVSQSGFRNLVIGGSGNNAGSVHAEDCREITLEGCSILGGSSSFLKLRGENNRQIRLFNNNATGAGRLVEPAAGKKVISEEGNLLK